MRSWQSSLPVLAQDLSDAGLSDVEVLVEHRLPLTSKRADAVLCGVHPRTGEPLPRRIRLVAYGASLESWLGASPRGFESPILRQQLP
jgi:uncharacterized protein